MNGIMLTEDAILETHLSAVAKRHAERVGCGIFATHHRQKRGQREQLGALIRTHPVVQNTAHDARVMTVCRR